MNFGIYRHQKHSSLSLSALQPALAARAGPLSVLARGGLPAGSFQEGTLTGRALASNKSVLLAMQTPVLDKQVFAFLLPYLPEDVFKVLRAAKFAVGKVACEAIFSL